MIELSADQRQAIDQGGIPLAVIDPRTGKHYLLVDQPTSSLPPETSNEKLSDSYLAQIETALRAGWDDPVMDEYNDYDRHRPS